MRLLFQCSLVFLAAAAWAAPSKIVEGKIERVGGEAWVLRVGTEAVPVAPEKATRYWAKRAVADATAFHVGDAVVARIAPDESPAALRELADKASWTWLDAIRKNPREGTMKAYDGKRLTLNLTDGTEISYRATEKSKVTLAGKTAALGDLKLGQRLWAKGRTLPNLDLWLVSASDTPIVAPKPGKKPLPAPAKPRKLPATGTLEGEIVGHTPGQTMFDLTVAGELIHVSYATATVFTFEGRRAGATELTKGRKATATYRRDGFGRILASKVEIRP